MEVRSSDRMLASMGRALPNAVTVELRSRVPAPRPPPLRAARPGVLTTPMRQLPAMRDLTALVRTLSDEAGLRTAIVRLQREMCSLLRLTDALCVWLDWPRRVVWSVTGRTSEQVQELVLGVAGSGRPSLLGSALLQPIGPPPARAVFAFRRSPGTTFDPGELAMISTLASGLAPALDRLIANDRL
jgi:hypothetical protein